MSSEQKQALPTELEIARELRFSDDYTDAELDKKRMFDIEAGDQEQRISHYASFLYDGDYEVFMPAIFAKPGSIEELEAQKARWLGKIRYWWIEKRFTRFLGTDWMRCQKMYNMSWKLYRLYDALLEKTKMGHYTMKPRKEL